MIDGTEELDLKLAKSGRGFSYITFEDLYGSKCSLQDSSIATADCVWLGVDAPFPGSTNPTVRMHLNRKQAAQLIKELQTFVDTGFIRDE